VEQLLQHGADINMVGAKGWSALMHACNGGHESVIYQLVGADVLVQAQVSPRALMHHPCTDRMLNCPLGVRGQFSMRSVQGCLLNARSCKGTVWTCIHFSAYGYPTVMFCESALQDGSNALKILISKGHTDLARTLQAQVQRKDYEGDL